MDYLTAFPLGGRPEELFHTLKRLLCEWNRRASKLHKLFQKQQKTQFKKNQQEKDRDQAQTKTQWLKQAGKVHKYSIVLVFNIDIK